MFHVEHSVRRSISTNSTILRISLLPLHGDGGKGFQGERRLPGAPGIIQSLLI